MYPLSSYLEIVHDDIEECSRKLESMLKKPVSIVNIEEIVDTLSNAQHHIEMSQKHIEEHVDHDKGK